MRLRPIARASSIIAMFACLALAACNGEEEEEEHEEPHEPTSPACVDLSEVCHEADTGSGPAHDCHETAHADDEAACAAALPDCMTACAT